jgi:hypothetical protein
MIEHLPVVPHTDLCANAHGCHKDSYVVLLQRAGRLRSSPVPLAAGCDTPWLAWRPSGCGRALRRTSMAEHRTRSSQYATTSADLQAVQPPMHVTPATITLAQA